MNRVILIGRLASDVELRYTQSSKAVANFRLAVNRTFSKEKKADFFRVVAWGAQAENVAKYLEKGSQCAVEGSIQIEQYKDKDGSDRWSTDIVASYVEFLGGKSSDKSSETYEKEDDFPTVSDDEIPF